MIKIKPKTILIHIALFVLTLANCKYIADQGYNDFAKYLGLLLLTVGLILGMLKSDKSDIRKATRFLVFTCFMFCIGICLQGSPIILKFRLCVSMLFIAIFAVYGRFAFNNFTQVYQATRVILYGCMVSLILSFFTGTELVTNALDTTSLFKIGFNGGLQHKNYYAAVLGICIIATYQYYKYVKKLYRLVLIMIIEIILLIATASRGGLLILLAYCAVEMMSIMDKLKGIQRSVVRIIWVAFIIAIAYVIYVILVENSSTYMYRTRGLDNYFKMFRLDSRAIMFGISGLVYSGEDYGTTIRSMMGWDGTVELSVLNVFIKNGMVGLIMYIILFFTYIKAYLTERKKNYRFTYIALFVSALTSTFVENYMVNTNVVYGPIVYCILASMFQWTKSSVKGDIEK